ncbi:hypothetical protein QSJ18_10190 [Gordonia sp. ABSL1-1]|uniref:hypothetical protein n=1 Tax=Gordonia sp. ABSL1-1 TaxID=3053923 RepID=UPI002572548A|nr:hypothetical protein [Gordonia sp. ABSL1-1]MDL9937111.1 hypothetical protein [Gordonia sp. ABSL1-1]
MIPGRHGAHKGRAARRTSRPNPTLNGFVLGTRKKGRNATPAENFAGLTYSDPFYREPRVPAGAKPGTLLRAKKVDVLFTGFKPGNVSAWKIMYVTENTRRTANDISTGIILLPEDGRPNSTRPIGAFRLR